MNRKIRRAAHSAHKKEVKTAFKADSWGPWIDITMECHLKLSDKPEIGRLKSYKKNNIYSAQIIESGKDILLGIRRHDQSTDVPWSHKQRIKNEIIGEEAYAIEIFPPQSQLVDQANMYWVWVTSPPLSGFDLNKTLRGIYS